MKKAIIFTLLILVVVLILLFQVKRANKTLPFVESKADPAIKIIFLDIGQGDATLIEWPDGTQMLIDCAKDARVLEALGRHMAFHDKTLDFLVVTHPDLDHYGGCTDVVERFEIKNIVYTGINKDNPTWQYFWQAALAETPSIYFIKSQQTWTVSSSTLNFLYPDSDLSGEVEGGNNASIVIKLSFGEMDALLTGDAEKETEEYLVQKYAGEIDVELLKVGHHGSQTSSIQPFVNAVTPEHAVISVGKENSYGHPSLRVVRRLERASSTIWRTDLLGDIVFYVYEDKIEPKI